MIRPAKLTDAQELGLIYAMAWKTAYHGILPAFFLELLTPERCAPNPDHIAPKRRMVAEEEGLVGTVTFDWHADGTGEIQSLYVLPAYWRTGQGSALFQSAMAQLRQNGASSISLWVLEENQAARCFFEHIGMSLTGASRETEIAGSYFREVQYRL